MADISPGSIVLSQAICAIKAVAADEMHVMSPFGVTCGAY